MSIESHRLPYPGLRAFDRDEADLFFGRDGAVDDMVDRLAETRFLAVLGASGTGKSSLVKTGLLDGLELGLHPAGADWTICTFTPGGKPFRNLAESLFDVQGEDNLSDDARANRVSVLEDFLRRGPRSLDEWFGDGYINEGGNLLLLVDQFEELFRFGGYTDREDAEAFVKLLIESTSAKDLPVHVVITMRSEFLGACALIPGLAETMNAGAYLTPRMTRDNCRDAIIGPARMVGMEIDDVLVTRMLNDLGAFAPWGGDDTADQLRRLSRRADQLPVMQHLLNRLWKQASDRSIDGSVGLTLADYEGLGGLNGALDAHGAELLSRFDDKTLPLIETVFRALVDGENPSLATRRPQRLSDIAAATGHSSDEICDIIDVFRADDCNFLRPGPAHRLEPESVVDISHESLIRQWSELSEWVAVEGRAAALWRRLSQATELHRNGEGGLLVGLDLANLSNWWHSENPTPGWAARYSDDFDEVEAFLLESERADLVEKNRRTERNRKQRRYLVGGLGLVSMLAIAATSAAVWGWRQQDTAIEVTRVAVEAADDMAIGLFERENDGFSVPIATRYAFVMDHELARENMRTGLVANAAFFEKQAELLLRTAETLLASGWSKEAAVRSDRLNKLISDPPADANWEPSIRLRILDKLIRAEILAFDGGHLESEKILDETEFLLEREELSKWERLRALGRLLHLRHENLYKTLEFDMLLAVSRRFTDLIEEAVSPYILVGGKFSAGVPEETRSVLEELLERLVKVRFDAFVYVHGQLDFKERSVIDQKEELDKINDYIRLYRQLSRSGSEKLQRLEIISLRAASLYEKNSQNNLQDSMKNISEAVRVAEDLSRADPDNIQNLEYLISALLHRADVAARLKNILQMRADINSVRTIEALLRERDNSSFNRRARSALNFEATGFLAVESISSKKSTYKHDLQYFSSMFTARRNFLQERSLLDERQFPRFHVFSAWMLLDKDVGLELTSEERKTLIEDALGSLLVDGKTGEDLYLRLKWRQFIFQKIASVSSDKVSAAEYISYLKQGVEEAARLAEITPSLEKWPGYVQYYTGRMAYAYKVLGDAENGRITFERALRQSLELVAKYPNSSVYVGNSTLYSMRLIEFANDMGANDTSMDLVNRFISNVVPGSPLDAWESVRYRIKPLLKALQLAEIQSLSGKGNTKGENTDIWPRFIEILRAKDDEIGQHLENKKIAADNLASGKELRQAAIAEAPDLTSLAETRVGADKAAARQTNWSFRPILLGAWRTLTRNEKEKLLAHHVSDRSLTAYDAEHVYFARKLALPFYQDGYLLELEVHEPEKAPRLITILSATGHSFPMVGSSPAIHEANAKAPLKLTSHEDVAAYLRFFTSYISGEEGSFVLVESVDEISWLEGASREEIASAETILRPVAIWKVSDSDSNWRASATVQYSNALFHALFSVQPRGMVEMLDDQPLKADLNLKPMKISDRRSGSSVRTELHKINLPIFVNDKRITSMRDDIDRLIAGINKNGPEEYEHLIDEYLFYLEDDIAARNLNENAKVMNSFAYNLIRKDVEVERATELAKSALGFIKGKFTWQTRDTYALGLIKLNRIDEAVSELEMAIADLKADGRSARNYSEISVHMAQAYRLAGKTDEARKMLAIAAEGKKDDYVRDLISSEQKLLDETQKIPAAN